MSGIRPRLPLNMANTYKVGGPIRGGQVIEARDDGLVYPAQAGSEHTLGVAEIDAKPFTNPVTTDADGFEVVNVDGLPEHVTAGFARYPVTFAADAGFGVALKAAANGQVTPWDSANDNANLVIGFCDEPNGVVVATNATGVAFISR